MTEDDGGFTRRAVIIAAGVGTAAGILERSGGDGGGVFGPVGGGTDTPGESVSGGGGGDGETQKTFLAWNEGGYNRHSYPVS